MMLIISMLSGGARVLHRHFDAKKTLQFIERYGITLIFSSPTITYRLTGLEINHSYKTDSLHTFIIGGGSISQKQLKALRQLLPCTYVHYTYGMTEASGTITIFHPIRDSQLESTKLSSVGCAVETIAFKVHEFYNFFRMQFNNYNISKIFHFFNANFYSKDFFISRLT